MGFTFFILMEAVILASSLSLDTFAAGFAYGTNKTTIPISSALIINFICSSITGLSLFAGMLLRPYLPQGLTLAVAFTVLFIIGLAKLFDSFTKSIIRKHRSIDMKINGSLFNFKFVLNVYADPETADIDSSKSISSMEAMLLAFSLSLDGIAVGFGAALANVNGIAVFLWSLIANFVFLITGHFLGRKLAVKAMFDLSYISGIVLIYLAISKLL